MQKNLIDTEQRIALARGYFNDIATQYNTRLEIVPERYVAGLAAMQPQTLMAANDFERAPVKVEADLPPPTHGLRTIGESSFSIATVGQTLGAGKRSWHSSF